MEIQLSHANRHASEATKSARILQAQIKVPREPPAQDIQQQARGLGFVKTQQQ